MEGLSVIIPVKPPEPYLPEILKKISQVLKNIPHEILIQHEIGLTKALIAGIKKSRFPYIAILDSDGSHNPKYLYSMQFLLSNAPHLDLVIGSKCIEGAQDQGSPGRRLISKCFRKFANFMLSLKVTDPMSGLVMGKKTLFLKLKPYTNYKWLLQILCFNPPPKVAEIPILFIARRKGKSKATFKTGINALHSIFKLWWKKVK